MKKVDAQKAPLSSSLLYFLAGSVASTGINILTSVVAASDRSVTALLLFLAGLCPLAAGFALSRIAAVSAVYEDRKTASRLHELSVGEVDAILAELAGERRPLVRVHLPLLAASIAFMVLLVATREYLLHRC